MHYVINVIAAAVTWTWNTAGWWLVAGFACAVVGVVAVEWRRR